MSPSIKYYNEDLNLVLLVFFFFFLPVEVVILSQTPKSLAFSPSLILLASVPMIPKLSSNDGFYEQFPAGHYQISRSFQLTSW